MTNKPASSTQVPDEVFHNNTGQIIGWVTGDTFFKRVRSSRHLHRKFNAYGIDKKVLDKLVDKKIRILDTDTNIVYNTDYDTFSSGHRHDFGFGEQVFLSLDKFDKGNPNQPKLI